MEIISKMNTKDKIVSTCDRLKDLLLKKNDKYGDSALNPVRIFSQADHLEQLRVRIDDKLSRIHTAHLDEDEDVIDDLLGYLILYKMALEDQKQPGGEVEIHFHQTDESLLLSPEEKEAIIKHWHKAYEKWQFPL